MSEPSPLPTACAPEVTEPFRAELSSLPLRVTLAAWAIPLTAAAASLYFFYTRGFSNLYGDGIAHMEGARRIFDSRHPGYPEIGSVWLPLFHLVVAPLAINDFLWRSGLGGSLISALAFALTAGVLFRLAFEMSRDRAAAAIALAAFVVPPNMLYLATTPLTEPLALLWSTLVVYGLFRFQQTGRSRALLGAGVAALLGTLTRYDEWYVLPFATLFVLRARRLGWRCRFRNAVVFAALSGLGPALWIAHNVYRFGNALDFYNGPFSAQAIYAHQLATTAFAYPTDGKLAVSARYYLSDLKLVIGFWPLILSAFGLLGWVLDRRERARRSAALLLLAPLPFYVHALAYAAVPLYVPTEFPNSYYNLRYGLEMLPAVALLSSFWFSPRLPRKTHTVLGALFAGILLAQAVATTRKGVSQLAVLREGVLNTPCRSGRQQAVIQFLGAHYDGTRVLIALGRWPCVMPQVGIPFRQTWSEGDRESWRRMASQPGKLVEWIVRGDGDSVDGLMRAYPEAFKDFELVFEGTVPREGRVAIYHRREAAEVARSASKAAPRWPHEAPEDSFRETARAR